MYICDKCGKEYARWQFKCSSCNETDSIIEKKGEIVSKKSVSFLNKYKRDDLPVVNLQQNKNFVSEEENRFKFANVELNNFFGKGLTEASITLLSGEPGIGKSTFLMQLPGLLEEPKKILYISGEESESQIFNRAKRLKMTKHDVNIAFCDSLEKTIAYLEHYKPDIFILDSLQTIRSEALDGGKGGIQQTKYCLSELISYLKPKNITSFFIGHVNKDGDVAGAKALEHLVDTVVYIEGETGRTDKFKLLKVIKNRYGALDKVVCFEMTEQGLNIISPAEASSYFIKDTLYNEPGCVLSANLEGNQLFLSEVQALVEKSDYSYPKRVITSFKGDRFDILIAIMKNKLKTQINDKDIYVNIINNTNFNVSDTLDLPIVAAIISKLTQISTGKKIFVGRIGLLGEIRTVHGQTEIIKKLKNLGFEEIISSDNCKNLEELRDMIIGVKK